MNLKLWIAAAVGALFIVVGGMFFIGQKSACRDFNQASLKVGSAELSVALAKSSGEQSLGLGGCSSLPKDSGMYFVYDEPRLVSFWMKGMLMPIDIIWIADGKVIGMEEFVPPPTSSKTELLPQYKPVREVSGVLEIAAGEAKEQGIKIEDAVTLSQ